MKNIGMGTGRRKTSVARVYIRDGKGKLLINDKDINEYFATAEQIRMAKVRHCYYGLRRRIKRTSRSLLAWNFQSLGAS